MVFRTVRQCRQSVFGFGLGLGSDRRIRPSTGFGGAQAFLSATAPGRATRWGKDERRLSRSVAKIDPFEIYQLNAMGAAHPDEETATLPRLAGPAILHLEGLPQFQEN